MHIYHYGADSQQFGQLFRPQNDAFLSVVIVVHGGYWKDNHSLDSYPTKQIVAYLANKNVAVWNLEYRRMNSVGANVSAPWPSIFNDVAQGIDFLTTLATEHKLDLRNVMIIGHSAGGHLATWAASRGMIDKNSALYKAEYLAIKTVIAIAGVLDLRRRNDLGQPQQIVKLLAGEFADGHSRIKNCNPAQLIDNSVKYIIMHGDKDKEVNIKQAISFVSSSNEANIVFHVLAGIDHFTMFPSFNENLQSWQLLQHIISDNLAL
ncbi:alpha/beta hydrolase [Pseudoalteromonas sp. S3260]|jgi:alpha-beta hydrolase superfamily lysophospholipase|uniref:alpha/beta hydrolase n=1 Tax=Pseudoalteromonas TaxID=53246 RepID=UPI00110B4E30|nr:alpha/beta hydrolase [Pseudoalteromonas sp. S3260]TMP00189.1 alpha/beta hydrolase [Pseudoalteromonas sp. S3260]